MTRQDLAQTHGEVLAAKYRAGATAVELAATVDASAVTVLAALRLLGVEIRRPGQSADGSPKRLLRGEKAATVARRYAAGESSSRLAAEYGVAVPTIVGTVRREGVPIRTQPVGSGHHSWKGGRIVNSQGYVAVRIPPDDPMRSMGQNGYVLEHRLLMARHLGRPLRRSETVHHRNGDRKDNRMENLQLRNGPHGKGFAARCAACGSTDIIFDPITAD